MALPNSGCGALLARIVLPVPLPTWNRLLAMNHWQRKRLRDATDRLASSLRPAYAGSEMPMELRPSTSLTPLLIADYFVAMGLKRSPKSRTGKSKRTRTKP